MVWLRSKWLLGLFYLLALGKIFTAWAQLGQAAVVTLTLKRLAVFANESTKPLADFSAAQLSALLAHSPQSNDTAASGVPIEAGKRVVLFLWLTLPANGALVNHLRHQLVFETTRGNTR